MLRAAPVRTRRPRGHAGRGLGLVPGPPQAGHQAVEPGRDQQPAAQPPGRAAQRVGQAVPEGQADDRHPDLEDAEDDGHLGAAGRASTPDTPMATAAAKLDRPTETAASTRANMASPVSQAAPVRHGHRGLRGHPRPPVYRWATTRRPTTEHA